MSLFHIGMSLQEFAIALARTLEKKGIGVILTGGAVVAIYSEGKYVSKDVDFISSEDHEVIKAAMIELGFESRGKDFFHPESPFSVEFPGYALMIGMEPMKPAGKLKEEGFALKLLSPTQCVMDRLSAYYHWKDPQSLEQAILV
ncbi:MAG TPA: hypothetical protein DCL41_10640, partial [Bdellovibrionales bacterium]|nr:hypothetical protein [Bdellovibrionales bacterium]